MKRGLFLLFLILTLVSPLAFALEQAPPEGLDDTLETIVEKGYNVTYSNRGWGTEFNLPQSQFSLDDTDFYNNAAEFEEVGLYVLGLQNLLHPQLESLDLNVGIASNIPATAQSVLPWVWTPNEVSFGTHHQGKLPNKGITNVFPEIMGAGGTSNVCAKDIKVAYNTWGVPKDTINKQTTSLLSTLAGTGQIFLSAAEQNTSEKETYLIIATGIGDMLLTTIVTPETEDFGVHPPQLLDTYDHTIPEGMMPYQFLILNDSPDTPACTDGGTIKFHENRKTHIAQAVVFWNQLSKKTGNEKYSRAAKIAADGILELQECDGSYKDYTRWEGSGINPNTCIPDDGSASYEAYPANVAVTETKGFITDTSTILYFLQKAYPNVYAENTHYRTATKYLLQLEEDDQGSGLAKNGDPVKYASYSIDIDNRPFAQLMMADVFLRASCVESDTSLQKRLQARAYKLIESADALVPSELEAKIANANSPDVGRNMLAVSAAADAWKIITQGCEECQDTDGDGHIDGACAKDTVKYDCNDNDASIYPGAEETCDGVDNDCDGKIDDAFDGDDDGVSTCAEPIDCDDENEDIYPGADEKVDGLDNDCSGKIDDAGIQFQLLNDQNAGIPNIETVFIDYGNVCANSYASLTESIETIKEQCTIVGTCTTDANGTCVMIITTDGKFQALANIPGNGLASSPVEYKAGKSVALLLQSDEPVTNGESEPGAIAGTNDYFIQGILVVLVVIGGLAAAYMIKTQSKGKPGAEMHGLKSPGRNEQAHAEKKMEPHVSHKKEFAFPTIRLPSLPKGKPPSEKRESSMLFSGKMNSVHRMADKIIRSPLLGADKWKMHERKTTNFPKKEERSTRKVWKDE